MSFNGAGVFVINSSGQPVSPGTTILAATFNAFTADIATGLSTCIAKDGQSIVTGNLPMSNFKITGLGAGTARTDGASLATIQDGTGVYVATVGGTADVITLTASPGITAYAAGQAFSFIASGANTTNVTVNINSLGAKAITKNGTTALVAGDIPSGTMVDIRYDGTRFILGTTGASVLAFTASSTDTFTNKTLLATGTGNVISGVIDRDVSTNDVVNTVTETTVYSFSVPGGTLGTNKALRLSLIGDYLNNTGSQRGMTPRVKYGATTIFTSPLTPFNSSATRSGFNIRTLLSANDATNAQVSTTRYIHSIPGEVDGSWDGVAPQMDVEVIHNAIAEDSTGAKTIAVTFEHSIADANLSVRALVVHLEVIR